MQIAELLTYTKYAQVGTRPGLDASLLSGWRGTSRHLIIKWPKERQLTNRTENCLPLLRSIALAWGGGELTKGAKLRGTYDGKLAKNVTPPTVRGARGSVTDGPP
ncbi:hypothetical protein CDAR_591451 [Caerostris darwini]|uniref:Uncharacterized protein n=1 Tax=Caerostris darwini TaxID=1538125 RepID=A0AAV4PHX8_9ARAC|nr:hypothetical protein CDAR_591451 [Caerostris darwini]